MSQEYNNTEELRKWFRQCPVLSEKNRFRVNYLSEDPTEYAIFASPSSIRTHENVLGENIPDDIQTINFIFASKETYGADVQQNLAAMGFYDEVIAWVMAQNVVRNFPHINEGIVKSVVPTLTTYLVQPGTDAAKYQINLKMTYRYIHQED